MPTRTDVQTDVHIVPVDYDLTVHNLLKLPTPIGALVLYIGTSPLHQHHSPVTSCVNTL